MAMSSWLYMPVTRSARCMVTYGWLALEPLPSARCSVLTHVRFTIDTVILQPFAGHLDQSGQGRIAEPVLVLTIAEHGGRVRNHRSKGLGRIGAADLAESVDGEDAYGQYVRVFILNEL